jgi:DNA-binding LacI/PurR family transcriptional regulator
MEPPDTPFLPDATSRVSHRDLARACGVSTATVSRALSGHPHVRAPVRDRVLATANRLGYRHDPRLAYLSRLRWAQGRSADSVKIVTLVDRFTGANPDDGKFIALHETARKLGYEIEFQLVEAVARAGPRLSRQYHHRGIQGILIALHSNDMLPLLDWERFSVVMVGEEYPTEPFHRVGTDWRQGFDSLTARMQREGRRVGFSLVRYAGEQRNAGRELNRIILSEALLQRAELAPERGGDAPLFRFDDDDPQARRRFQSWLREHHIDTVCCNDLSPARWLAKRKRRPRLYCLPWTEGARAFGLGGCAMQLGERFSLALRLLHENLIMDRRGFAPLPAKTLLPMRWEEPAPTPQANAPDARGRSHRR